MNSLIQELAEKAKNSVPQGILTPDKWIEEYNKIFAELIVRECAQYIEDKLDFCGDEFFITDKLKAHFGVK